MDFRADFPGATEPGLEALAAALDGARDTLLASLRAADGPYSGARPAELTALFDGVEVLPWAGAPLDDVLASLRDTVLAHSIRLTDPSCAAHLHQPPSVAGVAAEVLMSVANQSLDAFDASPAATMVETRLVAWLCEAAGFGAGGDGTFTTGATQSNLMGLLLARDAFCASVLGVDVRRSGLPRDADLRIVCTEHAHFSVAQSAAVLGVGEDAVAAVGAAEVAAAVQEHTPFAVVATAGSTDLGIVDPLAALGELCAATGTWLHVDAAYAGGLLVSPRHRDRLAGIERADSVAVDFHKLAFCPIGCGAFLLRDAARYELLRRHADYLNPASNAALGIPDLVGKSLLTTRAFDALKLWTVLQVLGAERIGAMIDHLLALAAATADAVRARPELELFESPRLTTVLFRHRGGDEVNDRIRLDLLWAGRAVIALTRIDGVVWLKVTLLNPTAQPADLEALLDAVSAASPPPG